MDKTLYEAWEDLRCATRYNELIDWIIRGLTIIIGFIAQAIKKLVKIYLKK